MVIPYVLVAMVKHVTDVTPIFRISEVILCQGKVLLMLSGVNQLYGEMENLTKQGYQV